MTNRPSFAIYIRAESGPMSVAEQIVTTRAYGFFHKWKLGPARTFIDDDGKTTAPRPAFERMMEATADYPVPFEHLVVNDVSQLFIYREAISGLRRILSRRGVTLHSVSHELSSSDELEEKIVGSLCDFLAGKHRRRV